MSKRQLKELQKAAGLVNLPTPLTHDLRLGVAGEGPYAYDWKDKPHRLVYTACAQIEANALLIAESPAMLEALREGVRAIGDHNAPIDCYATGPVTGNPFRDLVQCPACSFLAMAEPILARIDGGKS